MSGRCLCLCERECVSHRCSQSVVSVALWPAVETRQCDNGEIQKRDLCFVFLNIVFFLRSWHEAVELRAMRGWRVSVCVSKCVSKVYECVSV